MFARLREHRIRRMAARQGFALEKSWHTDPGAIDFEGYMIVYRNGDHPVFGAWPHRFSASLEEVEDWLKCFEEKL